MAIFTTKHLIDAITKEFKENNKYDQEAVHYILQKISSLGMLLEHSVSQLTEDELKTLNILVEEKIDIMKNGNKKAFVFISDQFDDYLAIVPKEHPNLLRNVLTKINQEIDSDYIDSLVIKTQVLFKTEEEIKTYDYPLIQSEDDIEELNIF